MLAYYTSLYVKNRELMRCEVAWLLEEPCSFLLSFVLPYVRSGVVSMSQQQTFRHKLNISSEHR